MFFLMGLLFRAALIVSVLMLWSFAVGTLIFDLPLPVAMNSLVMLLLTVVIGAIASRDIERSMRRGFLENALIGELVGRDGLTGLRNRRAFDERLVQIWRQALRERRSLAVLMIDIDHFKRYNDTHGHQAGDHVLRRVAQTVQGFARRPLDVAARYGGEELVLILYDTPQLFIETLAERLRSAVEQLSLDDAELGTLPPVSISIGGGVVEPSLESSPASAVQLADEALYEAKRAGRNRAVIRSSLASRSPATESRTPAVS